jgi:hypothetical protein
MHHGHWRPLKHPDQGVGLSSNPALHSIPPSPCQCCPICLHSLLLLSQSEFCPSAPQPSDLSPLTTRSEEVKTLQVR